MYVVLIEDELDEFTEADMRRWWRGKAIKRCRNGEVYFEVGLPARLNLWGGVKRLASFGIKARVAQRK